MFNFRLENRFSTVPLMETLKAEARAAGLWNLWMPRSHGGLSNEDYCPLAEMMGRVLWSPEVFNCNAPDTGNMEVFLKYATDAQQAQWRSLVLSFGSRSLTPRTPIQTVSGGSARRRGTRAARQSLQHSSRSRRSRRSTRSRCS